MSQMGSIADIPGLGPRVRFTSPADIGRYSITSSARASKLPRPLPIKVWAAMGQMWGGTKHTCILVSTNYQIPRHAGFGAPTALGFRSQLDSDRRRGPAHEQFSFCVEQFGFEEDYRAAAIDHPTATDHRSMLDRTNKADVQIN